MEVIINGEPQQLAEPLTVGVETTDKGIPEWRSTLGINWAIENWSASWTMRYLSDMTEACNADWTELGATCSSPLPTTLPPVHAIWPCTTTCRSSVRVSSPANCSSVPACRKPVSSLAF